MIRYFSSTMVALCLVSASLSDATTPDASKEHQVRSENDLEEDEKPIYQLLGPIYQKIYLFAFDDEQRHRTVVYVKRGLDPYEAMNVILRTETRAYESKRPKELLTPADRMRKTSPPIDYK